MSDSQRNFLIIGLVAVAIVALGPSGLNAFNSVSTIALLLLNIAFLALITYALFMAYRRNKDTIDMLPAGARTQLQVCAVGGYLVLLTGLFFPGWAQLSGLMALIFFALVAACVYGVYHAWQQRPFRW